MSDSAASFPGLGFDPAPGSPVAVAELAQTMTASQRQLTEALNLITSVGRSDTWRGDAASAFLSRVGQLPAHLQKAEDSFGAAARELNGWQSQLASMQQRAQQLESEARSARGQLRSLQANPSLNLAGKTFEQGAQLQQAQQEYDAAVQAVNAAQSDLDAVIEQADRLLAQHRGLAEEAAKAINAAAQLAPDAPGLFASLLGDVEALVLGNIKMAEDAWKWVQNHANAINAVGDMLSTASTIVGTIGLAFDAVGGEAIGAPLDAISAGLSGAALGTHLLARAAGAPVSDKTLAEDSIGMVTFGISKGLDAGKGAARLGKYLAEGDTLKTATNLVGLVPSWQDATRDPSSVGVFVPRSWGQASQELLPGGPLLVGFENAWREGSAKDRAAHGRA